MERGNRGRLMWRQLWRFCVQWRIFDYILCAIIGFGGWVLGRLVWPYCRPFSWNDETLAYPYGGHGTFPSWTLAPIAILPGVCYILVEAGLTFWSLYKDSSGEGLPAQTRSWHTENPTPAEVQRQMLNAEIAHPRESQETTAQVGRTGLLAERQVTANDEYENRRRKSRVRWCLFLHMANHWVLAQAFSAALTICIVDTTKVYAGRLRPDFLARLRLAGYNASSTDVDWCGLAREGRLSFPSGHSAISFASFVTLSLYCMSCMRAFCGGSLWRCAVSLIPLILPIVVAVSRTRDNRHHFSDILAGSVIGTTSALLSVGLLFAVSKQTGSLHVRRLEYTSKRDGSGGMNDLV